MNWAIKMISKSLMTKISHVLWGGYDKGFYGNLFVSIIKIKYITKELACILTINVKELFTKQEYWISIKILVVAIRRKKSKCWSIIDQIT